MTGAIKLRNVTGGGRRAPCSRSDFIIEPPPVRFHVVFLFWIAHLPRSPVSAAAGWLPSPSSATTFWLRWSCWFPPSCSLLWHLCPSSPSPRWSPQHIKSTLCWFGVPSRSSSLSLCRSIIFTVAAEPACPRLRRNGPREPGRTLMSRLQLSRRPWVQPQEACRISSRVHSTRTTRCSLFNKEMMRQICQTLGKIPRKSSHKRVNAPETMLTTHIWVSHLAKSILC